MHPDVAQARGAEQRIAERMQQHIAVGMREDAVGMRNLLSAKRDVIAVGEAVHVVTLSDAQRCHVPLRDCRIRSARARSSTTVILMLSASPATSRGCSPSASIACDSSVTLMWSEAAAASARRNKP